MQQKSWNAFLPWWGFEPWLLHKQSSTLTLRPSYIPMFTLACHKFNNYLTLPLSYNTLYAGGIALQYYNLHKTRKKSANSYTLVNRWERQLSLLAEVLIPVHTCQGLYSRPLEQFGRVVLLVFKILFIFVDTDCLLFPASSVLVCHFLWLYYKNKNSPQ